MTWLAQNRVLPLAGYPNGFSGNGDAIACAENLITHYTGCTFGSAGVSSIRVRLSAKSFTLELPKDAASTPVPTVTPAPTVGVITVGDGVLELLDANGQNLTWNPGTYTITLTRGFVTVPDDVIKAGSLLVAWFKGLSDPERSRYINTAQGDFSGTMRLTELPVPEAQAILNRYRTRVKASL
jgi:hypothetical protein